MGVGSARGVAILLVMGAIFLVCQTPSVSSSSRTSVEAAAVGCCTVILELPVTTAQDYTLFHLLNDRSIELWKTQIELILEKNGLASFIVHPDYIIDRETRSVYTNLLDHLRFLGGKKADLVWAFRRSRFLVEISKQDVH